MPGLPEITFLLPVCNGVGLLPRAVESVLAQHDTRWRMLIVDDASTDGTWEYVQTLEGPRVHVVRQDVNLGLYGTINAALAHVTTPWTSLFFQDDVLAPAYVQEMLALATRHPDVAFFWAAIDTIDRDGRVSSAGLDTRREEVIAPSASVWRDTLQRGCYWTISGSFNRTEALVRHGFRPDLPHVADFDLLLRLTRAEPLVYFETPLLATRIHQQQASAYNLASGSDLRERLKVIAEHARAYPGDLAGAFRWRLTRQLVGEVLLRAVVAIRRRRWFLLRTCAGLLPRAVSAASPVRGRRR